MSSKIYAYIFSVLYAASLVAMFYYVRISIRPPEQLEDVIYIEMVEPEPPPRKRPAPVPKVKVAPLHQKMSMRDNAQQVEGKAEETQTVNKRALFQMPKDGADKDIVAGNQTANEGPETTAKGKGGGLNITGTQYLDEGLKGRGLVGSLPKPPYPGGNETGKVVIRVTVNQAGEVTSARFDPHGSTTQSSALINAALKAARKARFKESKAFYEGGTITYIFKVK